MLTICFFVILLSTLTVILVLTRPSAEQKSMDKRMVGIKAAEGTANSPDHSLEQYLASRPTSSYQWLEEAIESSGMATSMQLLLLQADSRSTVGSTLVQCAGLGAAGAIAGLIFLHMLPLVLAAAGLAAYSPVLYLQFKRSRRVGKFNDCLPEAIDMMARSLRAGHSLVAALSIIAEQSPEPAKTEFGEVFKKQNYGLPLRDALLQLLDRVPSQDLRVLVTGIMVQKDTGGNLVDILERITQVIRERQRIKREISTHTAQGRMTGYILTALPLVMMFLINMVNPGYSNVLFSDPFGREILYAGAALLVVGGFIIRQIINGIEI